MKATKYIVLYNGVNRNYFHKCLFMSTAFLAITILLKAQSIVTNGHIINERREPVPFVNITSVTTGQVFTGDGNGGFNITLTQTDSILLFTCVGYEPLRFTLKNTTPPLTITLYPKVTQLKAVEIVSTGYQDIPKERATGSFVRIDNNELNQQTSPYILSRLDGISSGLLFQIGKQNSNPQNKLNITIRGLSTINGPLDPLVVLDGFIYEGNIENINPDNIDNITILKDAAATSIWGSRAGNGVIVINTKRGSYRKKLSIDASATVTVSDKADLYSLPFIKSTDYIDIEQMLFNNGYFDGQIYGTPYRALTPVIDMLIQKKNGLITSGDSASIINRLKTIDSRREYLKYFYTNPLVQQHAATIRGGGDKNAYSFSTTYNSSIGDIYNKSGKLNIAGDNSFQPFKSLQVNVGVYYTSNSSLSGRNQPYKTINTMGRTVPYLQFTDENGDPVAIATSLSNSYTDTAGGGKLLDWKYYPLDDYKYTKTALSSQEIFAYAGLLYRIHRFIDIDLKYQYQKQQSETDVIDDAQSFASRYLVNEFSQIDQATGNVIYIVPPGGKKNTSNTFIQSKTIRGQLNIHPSWRYNEINAIVGIETREAHTYGGEFSTFGYNKDPLTYSSVDFTNYYPDFITGGYSKIDGAPRVYPERFNRFVSVYGNASYSYKSKYILSASARKDGSNVFGLNTNDRWKPLWSVGGNWKISKEKFYHSSIVPELGMRLTFGYSGNIDLSKTAEAVASIGSGSEVSSLPYATIQSLNNPELKWEQSGILNIGIDFSSKKQIITGSIEYYLKKGTDLYGLTSYDYTTWGLSPYIIKNVADMQGSGIDITLNTRNTTGIIKWNTGFLLSFNQSHTTKYFSNESKSITSLVGSGGSINPVIGKPLYAIAAYRFGGLDAEGNPQGYLDGELSTDYRAIQNELFNDNWKDIIKFIGPASPTLFGSVRNTISYKRFTLSANITYKFGYYFWKPAVSSYTQIINSGIGQESYDKRWQNPGDEKITNIPAFTYPSDEYRDAFYLWSEVNVLKADNIRLQFINLAYSIGTNKESSPLKKATVYINVANVGLLWKASREKWDPDYVGTVKPARNYSLGIRVIF